MESSSKKTSPRFSVEAVISFFCILAVIGAGYVSNSVIRDFLLLVFAGLLIWIPHYFGRRSEPQFAILDPVPQLITTAADLPTDVAAREVGIVADAEPMPQTNDRLAAAQADLRGLQAGTSGLSQLAGQLGRATHDTNETASATTAAVDRITNIVGSIVETAAASERGFADISTAINEAAAMMQATQRQATESELLVNDLSTASLKVGSITASITRVAAQTRLLALNATIEASRAGDQGRGFAVVATEVKQLSTQTSVSAEEIGKIIREIEIKVSGVQVAIRSLAAGMGRIGGVVSELMRTNLQQSENNKRVSEALGRSITDTDAARNCANQLVRAAQEAGSIVRDLEDATVRVTRQADDVIHNVEASLVNFTTLTVLEWEGYFSKFAGVFEEYARARGHEIRLALYRDPSRNPIYLEGPEQLLRLLSEGRADIVSPTNSYFKMDRGELFSATIPLDLGQLTHWPDVLPSLREADYARGDRGVHAAPLLGGSVGLCWNARLLPRAPSSWRCFIDPAFKGRTGLTDGQWETNLYIAALLSGVPLAQVYDPPTTKDKEIQHHLDAMVANAGYFWGGMAEAKVLRNLFVTTDYWPGIAAANVEGQDWRLAEPTEGQPVWIDTMAITTTAAADPRKLDAAYLLLDFMLMPETQLRILRDLGVSTVNGAAAKLMMVDEVSRLHVGDSAFFNPKHMFQPLSPDTRQRFEEMWQRSLKYRTV